MPSRRTTPLAAIIAVLVTLVGWWVSRGPAPATAPPAGPTTPAPPPPARPAPPPTAPPPATRPAPPPTARPAPPPPADTALDLDAIADPDERAAITAVVTAIDRGGPFAYRRDGVVFENREGRLPAQPRGYWHEYTVPTPGSPDRGARRVIAGDRAELYYTRDHYRSFTAIRGPAP